MSSTNDSPAGPARVVLTPRQMHDRLALLTAALRSHERTTAAGLREQAVEARGLAEALDEPEALAIAEQSIGECELADDRPNEARVALMKALRVYEDRGNRDAAAATLLVLGRACVALRDVAGAQTAIDQAAGIYRALDDADGLSAAMSAIGELHAGIGDYVRAIECYNEALRWADVHADGRRLGLVHNALASIYAALGDDDRAADMFDRALALFGRSGATDMQARALASLGALRAAAGDMEGGLDCSLRGLVLMEALGDSVGAAETIMTIAMIHEHCGRRAEAIGSMEKAVELATRIAQPTLVASTLLGLAGLQARVGEPWGAVALLDRTLAVARDLGDRQLEYRAHELLAAAFEALGAPDKALEHYRLFMVLYDALRGEEKQRAIAELEVRFELAGAERERELYRLQAERLRVELDATAHELASVASGILQKSSALQVLTERMGSRLAQRRDLRDVLPILREEIDALRDPDDAWRTFEARFDRLHHDFIRTLTARYPTLSAIEVKLCAMLRADLATREIAAVLYVSERTVENHRYRLRRKMELPAYASLAEHLASL